MWLLKVFTNMKILYRQKYSGVCALYLLIKHELISFTIETKVLKKFVSWHHKIRLKRYKEFLMSNNFKIYASSVLI